MVEHFLWHLGMLPFFDNFSRKKWARYDLFIKYSYTTPIVHPSPGVSKTVLTNNNLKKEYRKCKMEAHKVKCLVVSVCLCLCALDAAQHMFYVDVCSGCSCCLDVSLSRLIANWMQWARERGVSIDCVCVCVGGVSFLCLPWMNGTSDRTKTQDILSSNSFWGQSHECVALIVDFFSQFCFVKVNLMRLLFCLCKHQWEPCFVFVCVSSPNKLLFSIIRTILAYYRE